MIENNVQIKAENLTVGYGDNVLMKEINFNINKLTVMLIINILLSNTEVISLTCINHFDYATCSPFLVCIVELNLLVNTASVYTILLHELYSGTDLSINIVDE